MPPRRKQQQQQQPTASVLESLPTNIAKIFEQVQTSKATWAKNSVTLHKLHSQAAQITDDSEPNRIRIIGERAFEIAFIDALNRIVAVKKGTTVADRVVHFIGQWVNTIVTEDAKVRAANPPDEDDNQESTPTTRFTGRIIQHLMKGFEAKDKNVRYRCVQLVAMIVAQLQELDPELYDKLRKALTERINDKEATVRAQAVAVLAKLCGAEDIDELEDDDRPAKEILLEMLAHDASGDVRRAVLVNIRIDAETLPAIIERTRDVEPATRKLVFTHVLLPNIWVKQQQPPPDANANQDGADANEPVMGLTHPRALTIQQREDIVSTGLGDREDAVRAAAGTLVSEWVQALGAGKTTDDSAMEDLLALLSTFDLVSGVTNAVAQDAIKSVLVTRKDIFSALKFEADYWKAEALSPEKIFLARVFIDYCKAKKEDESIEKMLPVVTAWAFHVQSAYNLLSQDMEAYDLEVQNAAEDEVLFEKEEARNARVFVVVEMLRIALVLDYADEVGRRKMFQLIRNMISQEGLPEPLVMPCMDVLRILVNDEADLIRLVVQIVHELRDVMDEMNSLPPEDSQMSVAPSAIAMPQRRPREDMAPEELKRSDDLDIRCLDLCIGMLERINSTFQDHSTLEGMLKELMIPAVMRKEMIFRERGLVCLGLCSLIAPKMAMGTFELFKNQVKTAPEPLKIKVLQIMFDVVMVHEREFMGPPGLKSEIESLLVEQLTDDSSKVRAQVCKGLAKLMLAGMTTANQILCALVMEFFSPDSADNQQLRQCLIYFFPIYCYSSSANQRRMMDNFLSIYKTFLHMHSMLDEGEEMVSPAQFTSMFIEWTNPQHAIDVPDRAYDEEVHLDFAAVIMKELLQPTPFDVDGSKVELRKEDKKVMCQMLPKLFLPIEADDLRVRSLRLLTHKLGTTRPVRDAVAFNAINKFDSALTKHYDAQLDGFDEDEYRKLEELTNLFAFLDDIFGSDDDGELVEPTTKRGRKRRSESITDEDTSEEEDGDSTPRPKKQKGRVGKRRKMATDGDDDEEDDDHPTMRRTPPASAVKTRSMPKRAATKKVDVRAMSVQEEDEEANEDEDDDDPTEMTPVPTRKTASSTRHQRAETDDEQEQEHDPPPDSEDDDQEVDALLEEE